MISDHPSFKHPSDLNIKIWRYMDLAKFVSLLFNRALHFARADTLGDPFEGSITKLQYDLRDQIVAHRHTDPRFADWRALPDDVLQKMFSHQAAFNKQATSFCYINCWHMNAHESAAMWRLYSQSDEAVCIQSTFKRLAEGMPSYVQAGEVNYIDYENGIIPVGNILNLFLTKRLSFSHESELRAIILAPPTKPTSRAPRHRRAHHSTAASAMPALPKMDRCGTAA